jgi:hypothetical protein
MALIAAVGEDVDDEAIVFEVVGAWREERE